MARAYYLVTLIMALLTSAMATSAFARDQLLPEPKEKPISVNAAHAGFCYGAFWPKDESPKTYNDFLRLFRQAKNLPGTPVSFSSARLFQTGQWQQPTVPSEALKAAMETNTTLLLGIWLPSISTELVALEHAFQTHGQKLADLVVGISVGNEDIYRASTECQKHSNNQPCPTQATTEQVKGNVTIVRDAMKKWNHLFTKPIPIGHVDVVQYAAQEDLDFIGANIYPYWANDSIVKAKESMDKQFNEVAQNASSRPVWVTETGWPSSGKEEGTLFAGSIQDMRSYWVNVGCKYFGKRNIWWFQLEQDTKDVFDWGILDANTKQPKFDLSCPQAASPNSTSVSQSSQPGKTVVATNTVCNAKKVTVTVTSTTTVSAVTTDALA